MLPHGSDRLDGRGAVVLAACRGVGELVAVVVQDALPADLGLVVEMRTAAAGAGGQCVAVVGPFVVVDVGCDASDRVPLASAPGHLEPEAQFGEQSVLGVIRREELEAEVEAEALDVFDVVDAEVAVVLVDAGYLTVLVDGDDTQVGLVQRGDAGGLVVRVVHVVVQRNSFGRGQSATMRNQSTCNQGSW